MLMNDRALIALRLKGSPWFNALCESWRKRTGYDPVSVAECIARLDRRRNYWNFGPMIFAGAVCLLTALSFIFIGLSTGPESVAPEIAPWTVAIVLLILVGSFVLSRIMLSLIPRNEEIYPIDATMFGPYLASFLYWIEKTPDDFDYADVELLGDLAHGLLVDTAFETIKAQREKPEEHWDTWGIKVEGLRQDMKRAHSYLVALGLARPLFDEYWKEAEARFEAAA